jgi:hypothetical protein
MPEHSRPYRGGHTGRGGAHEGRSGCGWPIWLLLAVAIAVVVIVAFKH